MKKLIFGLLVACSANLANAGEVSITGRVLFTIPGADMTALGLQEVTYANTSIDATRPMPSQKEQRAARMILSLNNNEMDDNQNYLGNFSMDEMILKQVISSLKKHQVVQIKLNCEKHPRVRSFAAVPQGQNLGPKRVDELGLSRVDKCKLLSHQILDENPEYVWLQPQVAVYERCGLFRGGISEANNMIASPNPQNSVANNDAACSNYCSQSNPKSGDMCLRGSRVIRAF